MCIGQSGGCAIKPAEGKQGVVERSSHPAGNLKGGRGTSGAGTNADFFAARNRSDVVPKPARFTEAPS